MSVTRRTFDIDLSSDIRAPTECTWPVDSTVKSGESLAEGTLLLSRIWRSCRRYTAFARSMIMKLFRETSIEGIILPCRLRGSLRLKGTPISIPGA